MVDSHDGGKKDEKIETLVPEFLIFSDSYEHLCVSIRMTYIRDFIGFCDILDFLDLSWSIESPHLYHTEIPEFLVCSWVQLDMASRVNGPPIIA